MRIIGGIARGLALEAPRGRAVRPTGDRVRESLFAALGDIRGLRVADLFAGTGALGLEALSRGAAAALFVEKNPRHARVIERNLAKVLRALEAAGRPAPRTRVFRAEVRTALRRTPEWSGNLDLVLADPPYRPEPGDWGAAELLADSRFHAWVGAAWVVIEHAAEVRIPPEPVRAGAPAWHLVRQKRYGTTAISILRAAPASAPGGP